MQISVTMVKQLLRMKCQVYSTKQIKTSDSDNSGYESPKEGSLDDFYDPYQNDLWNPDANVKEFYHKGCISKLSAENQLARQFLHLNASDSSSRLSSSALDEILNGYRNFRI